MCVCMCSSVPVFLSFTNTCKVAALSTFFLCVYHVFCWVCLCYSLCCFCLCSFFLSLLRLYLRLFLWLGDSLSFSFCLFFFLLRSFLFHPYRSVFCLFVSFLTHLALKNSGEERGGNEREERSERGLHGTLGLAHLSHTHTLSLCGGLCVELSGHQALLLLLFSFTAANLCGNDVALHGDERRNTDTKTASPPTHAHSREERGACKGFSTSISPFCSVFFGCPPLRFLLLFVFAWKVHPGGMCGASLALFFFSRYACV